MTLAGNYVSDQVLPAQRLPHRDSDGLPAGEGMAAMVLYLFKDERYGGTSFFKPRVPMQEIAALLQELKRQELAGETPSADEAATFAIAWTLSRDFVGSTIIGATRREQLDDTLAASGVTIPEEALRAVDRLSSDIRYPME